MASAPSLHRLLVRRLLGMTALICVVMASLAYWRELERYDEAILSATLQGAEDFRRRILTELDEPESLRAGGIQVVLDRLAQGPPTGVQARDDLGRIVSVRITDTAFQVIAAHTETDYPLAAQVAEFLRTHRHPFAPDSQNLFRTLVRIGGRPHLHLGMALADSQGRPSVYAESVYAVSDKVLADIASGMARTVALVVLVVLATTLLLYPVIVRLLRRVTALSVHLQEANLELLRVLGGAIAKRDSDTDQHNYRVTLYAVRLAEALGWSAPAIRALIKGALLHDVGKIGIRDAILLKPGRLTEEEFAEMRRHVQHGRDIVAQAPWLADALPVISGHHERFDGGGYDQGLADGAIPPGARLFAIVDVFDALTSHRPYKQALSFEESMALLAQGRGAHFDPAMLDAFAAVARPLYQATAASSGAELKAALQAVFQRYFTGDVAEMLRQADALEVEAGPRT